MHHRSRWNVPIPDVHLASLLFESPTHPLPTTDRCFIDAARPDTHYFTTHGFRLSCQQFAAGLIQSGIQPGDRILVFASNHLFSPVHFIGAVMAGAVYTAGNPSFGPQELAHLLRDSGPSYMICEGAVLDTALRGGEQVGMDADRIFVFDRRRYEDAVSLDQYLGDGRAIRPPQCRDWCELMATPEEGRQFVWEDLCTPELSTRTIALNYSSGTSGTPKGVEISHKNCVAHVLQWAYRCSLDPGYEDRLRRARWLCCLPLYHSIGQNIFIIAALRVRTPVYIMLKFDVLQLLEYTDRFRITELMLVGPMLVQLAKDPASRSGRFDLSSVEGIRSGGAPLSREASEEAEALWGGKVNTKQGWGMTETTCSFLGWDPRDRSLSSSVGELNPNCEAKIMADDNTTELGYNERGELWVRGPNVMKGYWNNIRATMDTKTPDGWLKTGDIAYVDPDSRFYIVDRKKEIMKVHGRQVAPAELEALLLEHPAIAEAAVVGISVDCDERPRAYVVRRVGQEVTDEDIHRFFNDSNVAPHKRLTGGVIFCPSLPKNASGKILRRELRACAQKEFQETVMTG